MRRVRQAMALAFVVIMGLRVWLMQGARVFFYALMAGVTLWVGWTVGLELYLRRLEQKFGDHDDIVWRARARCPTLDFDRIGILWLTDEGLYFGKVYDKPMVQLEWSQPLVPTPIDWASVFRPPSGPCLMVDTAESNWRFFFFAKISPLYYSEKVRDACLEEVAARMRPVPGWSPPKK